MGTNELHRARLAEAKAQRDYDLMTTMTTGLLATIGLAAPLFVGLALYMDNFHTATSDRYSASMRHHQEQIDEFKVGCLKVSTSPSEETIRRYYCERERQAQDAYDPYKWIAGDDRRSPAVPMLVLEALGLLSIIAGVCAFMLLRRLSQSVSRAQGRRIALELDSEDRGRYLTRRVAGRRNRP